MIVYRLQKATYKSNISGVGSTLVSGRWHVAGSVPMLHTTSNRSLAILEILSQLPKGIPGPKLNMLSIKIPDASVVIIDPTILPKGWDVLGQRIGVQNFGMDWLRSMSSLAIAVPSVISGDNNILINPMHPQFKMVKVVDTYKDFDIDSRLLV